MHGRLWHLIITHNTFYLRKRIMADNIRGKQAPTVFSSTSINVGSSATADKPRFSRS